MDDCSAVERHAVWYVIGCDRRSVLGIDLARLTPRDVVIRIEQFNVPFKTWIGDHRPWASASHLEPTNRGSLSPRRAQR